jgi:hypothetical protein
VSCQNQTPLRTIDVAQTRIETFFHPQLTFGHFFWVRTVVINQHITCEAGHRESDHK